MYQLISLQAKFPPKTKKKYATYTEARVALRSIMRQMKLWKSRQHPSVYLMNRCGFGIIKVS